MRQQLPEGAGYPLTVPGVGDVYPGGEFGCDLPVPGCVPLDGEPAEPAAGGAEGHGSVSAADAPAQPGGEPAGERTEAPGAAGEDSDSKPAGRARSSKGNAQ